MVETRGPLLEADGVDGPAADGAVGHAEDADEGRAVAAAATLGDGDGDSKGAHQKKSKKKKKKKKGGGDRERGAMPTQALVDRAFPWTTVVNPTVGRCAVASRAIKAGEVVVAERALAFIPRSQDRRTVCHSCCKDVSPPSASYECRSCRYSVFCKDCNKDALEQHRSWCHFTKAIEEISQATDCDADLLHLVLALARQKHPSGPEIRDGANDEGLGKGTIESGIIYPSYEDAVCLISHNDKAAMEWKSSVRKGCQLTYDVAVKSIGADGMHFTVDDLESLAQLVNTNSHGMGAHGSGIHNTDVAVGIFPFVSMLNHSCRPNCCFASDGRVMYVRAMRDIPKDTELCISYINLYEPRGTRQMQLATTKHFICQCQRCTEPFASSTDRFLEGCVCTVRGCGGVLVKSSNLHEKDSRENSTMSLSSWQCDQCSRVVDPCLKAGNSTKGGSFEDRPWLLIPKAEQKLSEAMSVYRERRFKDARVMLEQFLSEFTGKLHPWNVLVFDSLTPLMNCCRALGDAAEGSRVCRNILNCMEKVQPGISLELANFYFCLGEMHMERSEASSSNVMSKHYRKLAQETFQHVRMIRETCLGTATLPA